jgi:transglutaminase-like putative cysteine protease
MNVSIELPSRPTSERRLNRRQALQALGLGAFGALSVAGAVAARQDLTVAPPTAEATGPTATLPTVADKAAELEYDLERIFRFVADEVHYEAYAGALRGAKGTLLSRAGNSVDQALLLAALLDEAFVTYRFAIGEIDEVSAAAIEATLSVELETLRERRAHLYGVAPDDAAILSPEDETVLDQVLEAVATGRDRAAEWIAASAKLVTDALTAEGIDLPAPAAPALPDRERHAHVWVQYADGPLWIDLDPSIPEARPGTAYATAAETPATLPTDLDHLVRVTLVAEEAIGGAPRRRDVVAYEATSRDLVGVPLAIAALPPDDVEGFGLAINRMFTGLASFAPMISTPYGGVVADIPLVLGAGDGETLLDEIVGDGEESPIGDGEAIALWLKVEVQSPDRLPVIVERPMFDRLDPTARAADEPDLSTIAPVDLVRLPDGRETFAPLATVTVLDVTSGTLPNTLALNDAEAAALLDTLHGFAPSYVALRDGLLLERAADLGWWAYPDGPNVTAFVFSSAEPADGEAPVIVSADLIHRAMAWAAVAAGPSGSTHPGVLLGAVDQVAERMILDPTLIGSGVAGIVPGPNVGRVFEVAAEQGVAVRPLTPENTGALSELDLSSGAAALIAGHLAAGLIVVVPAAPVEVDGARLSGWWLIDPETGRTTDQLEDGRGGARAALRRSPITERTVQNAVWAKIRQEGVVKALNCLGNILGWSAAIAALFIVAGDDAKVLVTGLAGAAQGLRVIGACGYAAV